jgi:soluble lytic murein transglycosylase
MNQFYRFFLLLLVALFLPSWSGADIYMFIDREGMVHFTNVPTSPDYKLYIREKPKPAIKGKGLRFDREIKRAAKAFGVEASLVKAVIKAESDFDPSAVSKRGATGLMQLMPSNYDDFKVSDPFDPGQNIMGGTRYLKRLMNRYQGKIPLVLAAYNAGPDAVDRYKSVPPFKETQRYVNKVMKFYSLYKR